MGKEGSRRRGLCLFFKVGGPEAAGWLAGISGIVMAYSESAQARAGWVAESGELGDEARGARGVTPPESWRSRF